MASSSTMPCLSETIELRPNGFGIPLLFPIDANGFVSSSLQNSTIWVECKIYDNATSLLSLTMREHSRVADNGSSVWELCAGKYRVCGLPDSCPNVSTEIVTPPHISSSTLNTPRVVKVKIEPGIQTVIHLSDSSEGDEPPLSTPILKPSPSSLNSPFLTPFVGLQPLCPLPLSPAKPSISILQCLRSFASMPSRKNILKKLDYDTLQIEEVNFLPPRFDGNRMFVLPPVGVSTSHTKAKSIDGMDKCYDSYVWTKTQTTNITNDMGLVFCSSICVGHLQCQILSEITSNVLIAPPWSMILISTASQRNPSPLVVHFL